MQATLRTKMFQVDLELHQEFCMATQNQDKQPDLSNPKVKALKEIIDNLALKKAIEEANKQKENKKPK
jgi:hemoglobin-like flavoprotein